VQWDPERNPERHSGNAAGQAAASTSGAAAFYIGPPAKDSITRTVVLKSREPEGEGLWRLVFSDPQGAPLPAWSAGAHVDVVVGGYRRKYSLCGVPEERGTLQVVVQREAEGRGGSRHICDTLQPGDTLQLAGPKNLFRLDESAGRYLLFAAGIGITPMLAMADRLQRLGKPYTLHYAGRSRAQMAMLARAERDHGGALRCYVKAEGQRMDLSALVAGMGANDRVYACGPNRLIDELESLGAAWPEGVLHYEHFSGEGSGLQPEKEHAFVAELQDSKVQVVVPRDRTLLQALQAAGFDVPCDCGEGLCGTCEVAVVEGEVDHRDKVLTKTERAANRRMLACCSRAAGEKIVLAL
jgi:ferredoxin-NADP reductase